MIRAVIIGFAHMHVNEIALYIDGQPEFELAGAAQARSGAGKTKDYPYTPGWNQENIRKNYCGRIYEDYVQMLEEEKPDLAFILTENSMKPEVTEACAKRGVSVCIEKPVASSLKEAENIEASVKTYGIEAMVNWPVAWRPYLHRLKNALDARIAGEPLELRYWNGHTGPLGKGAKHRGAVQKAGEMTDDERSQCWWYQKRFGGGVLLDIGCYGCLFAKWLLGDGEKSVFARGANLNTSYGEVEDNFAAIVAYEGRMAVLEGTWTAPRALMPSGPMVICREGVLFCTGSAEGEPDIRALDLYGREIPVPEYREEKRFLNMPWHYAWHKETGEPAYEILTLEKNMEIMRMLDALIRSGGSGKEERILE